MSSSMTVGWNEHGSALPSELHISSCGVSAAKCSWESSCVTLSSTRARRTFEVWSTWSSCMHSPMVSFALRSTFHFMLVAALRALRTVVTPGLLPTIEGRVTPPTRPFLCFDGNACSVDLKLIKDDVIYRTLGLEMLPGRRKSPLLRCAQVGK